MVIGALELGRRAVALPLLAFVALLSLLPIGDDKSDGPPESVLTAGDGTATGLSLVA